MLVPFPMFATGSISWHPPTGSAISIFPSTITFTTSSFTGAGARAISVPVQSDDIILGHPNSTQIRISSHDDGSIRLTLQHKQGHSFELKLNDDPEVKRALIAITKMFVPIKE